MRYAICIPVLAILFTLSANLATAQPVAAASKASVPALKLIPAKPADAAEKAKNLGKYLGRALDLAVDLLSGNETDMLSKNKTDLLSGNEAELLSKNAMLSGNKPNMLNGNQPKVLSENRAQFFSGNNFSLFSNIKVEISINNSGNNAIRPRQQGEAPQYPPSYEPGASAAPVPSVTPSK